MPRSTPARPSVSGAAVVSGAAADEVGGAAADVAARRVEVVAVVVGVAAGCEEGSEAGDAGCPRDEPAAAERARQMVRQALIGRRALGILHPSSPPWWNHVVPPDRRGDSERLNVGTPERRPF